MDLRVITKNQKKEYNNLVTHIMQSWEWGEFREKMGLKLLRLGIYEKGKLVKAFQLTIHKIPLTNSYVGYLPKGPMVDSQLAQALKQIAKEYNCAFIKIEPNILKSQDIKETIDPLFKRSPKSLFTRYNFLIDLTQSEEEILKRMHQKTRYNIKVAQKHGVNVEERTDDKAFDIFAKLYFDTTNRQQYYGHNFQYHKTAWQTLAKAGIARVLVAFYTPSKTEGKIPLNAWMIYHFQDKIYYPYGGSSDKYRNVMAPTLAAWEAIRLGKRLNAKTFDLWGALEPDAPENHPWHGFHQFKARLGAELVEYIGTFDLITNYPVYVLFNTIDKFTAFKVLLLKLFQK